MSTCSMQKAKSYLPTRGGGEGPERGGRAREAVRLRHGHSAVSVRKKCTHEGGREGGKKGLNLGKVQCLSSSSSLKCFEFK